MKEQKNELFKADQKKQPQENISHENHSYKKSSFLTPFLVAIPACYLIYYYSENPIFVCYFLMIAGLLSSHYWKMTRDKKYKKEAIIKRESDISKPFSTARLAINGWPQAVFLMSVLIFCASIYWFFTDQIKFGTLLFSLLFLIYAISGILTDLVIGKIDYFKGRRLVIFWNSISCTFIFVVHVWNNITSTFLFWIITILTIAINFFITLIIFLQVKKRQKKS